MLVDIMIATGLLQQENDKDNRNGIIIVMDQKYNEKLHTSVLITLIVTTTHRGCVLLRLILNANDDVRDPSAPYLS